MSGGTSEINKGLENQQPGSPRKPISSELSLAVSFCTACIVSLAFKPVHFQRFSGILKYLII